MNQEGLHNLIIYQKRYFEILTDFFNSVTGCSAQSFATLDTFSEELNLLAEKLRGDSKREAEFIRAFSLLESKLKILYSSESENAFQSAKSLDANKLNIGGGSRFLKTHLNATRRSLLFSDIVLIPDPLMPWLENKREEERFRHVIPIQMAFFLLHLSDLISEEFDIPPFFVFPSFEKTLEEHDEQTQRNSIQLVTDVFSYYVDEGIQAPEDIFDFAISNTDLLISKIEGANLFVSPGGNLGESVKVSLASYKSEMRHSRSESWCDEMFGKGDIAVLLNGIFERITPNYHLLENSDELRSHPFLCVEAQAHYYQLIANMKNDKISKSAAFDTSTTAILRSLTSSRLDFLANINNSQIIDLRKSDENVVFRRELRDLVNSLSASKMDDIGIVAGEVCAHIEATISKHKKQVEVFNEKYKAKHKYTAMLGMGTLGVTMLPVLAPFLGAILPLGLTSTAGKYVSDKLDEKAERKQYSHSMMGVMSLAQDTKR